MPHPCRVLCDRVGILTLMWKWIRDEKQELLWLFRRRDHGKLQGLPLSISDADRDSLPFVVLKKLGIVVGIAVHALPGKQRVSAGGNAAQGEPPALISDGLPVTGCAPAGPRIGNGNHNGIRDRLSLAVADHSTDYTATIARDQIEHHGPAIHGDARVAKVAASRCNRSQEPVSTRVTLA